MYNMLMKRIPLTRGKYAVVDDDDYNALGQYPWCYMSVGYAYNRELGYMHRAITKPGKGLQVDHINHDKLDNRRENLRVCTGGQNTANRPKMRSKSGYKGIWWWESRKKYKVYIGSGKKQITIGYFSSLDEAISARQQAVKEYHGEYASTAA